VISIQAGEPLPPRLWDNHGVVALVLPVTLYTDLKRYGHPVILLSEKSRASYQAPSISGYKETGEIGNTAGTALDLLGVTDENESLVEVHITKNRHFKFKDFAGVLHREWSWWCTKLHRAAPAP